MNPQEMLERLVANAIDFLSRSIDEIDNNPKFSVIHFYTAVELFLKARLLAEHWSLLVSKCQTPDINKFQSGDFISVSLEEAKEKLEKVLGIRISKEKFDAFTIVRGHRNKMVHFFHEAHSTKQDEALREKIAKEHLGAWYSLNRLLLHEWKDVFEPWKVKITQLDERLRNLNQYLQVVFEKFEPEIDARKKRGSTFTKCPSCDFNSYEHHQIVGDFYDPECIVCGFLGGSVIRIDCPDCARPIFFENEGFGACESCGKKIEPRDLSTAIIDAHENTYLSIKNGDFEGAGNCASCDGYQTVVRIRGRYFCASCFQWSDELQKCDYCGDINNGVMDDSYLWGCGICSGKLGSE